MKHSTNAPLLPPRELRAPPESQTIPKKLPRRSLPRRSLPRRSLPRSAATWVACLMCALPLATPLTAKADANARIEKIERDGVVATISFSPPEVDLSRDTEITIELTYPSELSVRLPASFDDRLDGFHIEGMYESDSLTAGGTTRRALHLRARPIPAADRYRLAPFPIQVHGASRNAKTDTWFPTKPVVLHLAALLPTGETTPNEVTADLQPIRVRPSMRTISRWLGLAALIAAGITLLAFLARKLKRRIKLARMAPRERALLELRELLARDLPGKGRAKEFYVALTLVVRRYIERRYAIRAPEQTTEEFLHAASEHTEFARDTVALLSQFLDAADLVKFAGVEASPEMIQNSERTARGYIENEPSAPPSIAKGAVR